VLHVGCGRNDTQKIVSLCIRTSRDIKVCLIFGWRHLNLVYIGQSLENITIFVLKWSTVVFIGQTWTHLFLNSQHHSQKQDTWINNKVRELIAVKALHTSLLNTTVVAFKVLPLGSYAPMPAPSPPTKNILEFFLWNVPQSCLCITPDFINFIKMPFFNIFFIFGNRKKSLGARSG